MLINTWLIEHREVRRILFLLFPLSLLGTMCSVTLFLMMVISGPIRPSVAYKPPIGTKWAFVLLVIFVAVLIFCSKAWSVENYIYRKDEIIDFINADYITLTQQGDLLAKTITDEDGNVYEKYLHVNEYVKNINVNKLTVQIEEDIRIPGVRTKLLIPFKVNGNGKDDIEFVWK